MMKIQINFMHVLNHIGTHFGHSESSHLPTLHKSFTFNSGISIILLTFLEIIIALSFTDDFSNKVFMSYFVISIVLTSVAHVIILFQYCFREAETETNV